jgi:diadenosine tetraphosphate (Ap4A) HIT family hydrolase
VWLCRRVALGLSCLAVILEARRFRSPASITAEALGRQQLAIEQQQRLLLELTEAQRRVEDELRTHLGSLDRRLLLLRDAGPPPQLRQHTHTHTLPRPPTGTGTGTGTGSCGSRGVGKAGAMHEEEEEEEEEELWEGGRSDDHDDAEPPRRRRRLDGAGASPRRPRRRSPPPSGGGGGGGTWLWSLTVVQLRERLRRLGLPRSGRKAELVARALAAGVRRRPTGE